MYSGQGPDFSGGKDSKNKAAFARKITVNSSMFSKSSRSHTVNSAKFKSEKSKISTKEVKEAFQEIFKFCDSRSDRLQAKLDYFYKGYNHGIGTPLYMQFEDNVDQTADSNEDQVFYKTAQSKWNNISNNILQGNEEHFRGFLKSVNTEMYDKLIRLGEKYFSKYSFPKSEAGRRDSEQTLQDKSHAHFNKGIKLLRDVIKEKVLTKRRNQSCEPNKGIGSTNMSKNALITPLVYISRANSKPLQLKVDQHTELDTPKPMTAESKSKTTEKLCFTPFAKLMKAANIEQTYRNLIRKPYIKSSDGKPVKRRKSLFKFLHSEKQIPAMKPKNCYGCLTVRKGLKDRSCRAKSIATVRSKSKARRSLNTQTGMKLRPRLRVITDKNILLKTQPECKCVSSVTGGNTTKSGDSGSNSSIHE